SFSFRLAGEEDPCQGAVQMMSQDSWLHVCNEFWDSALSALVCRELDCGQPEEQHHLERQTLNDNETSQFIRINCCNKESLNYCNITHVTGEHCPGPAVVRCADPPILRLSGGGSPCEGRVELFLDGLWGSVCDDGWDVLDAHVTCQQLHCGSALQAIGGSHFGPGPSHIYFEQVNCAGVERLLWECPAKVEHDCSNQEHAGVICTEHRAVRLQGPPGSCAGRVEVYMNGVWGTVCNSPWFSDDSEMLCRTLGCGSFVNQTSHDHSLSTFVGFVCPDNVASLWDCRAHSKNRNICAESRALGLVCN
ncbi:T-cell differentiation antigen CD6-like, partial [Rhinophrynus dorsalis]